MVQLKPVAVYKKPNFPPLDEVRANPALLKTLPSRWRIAPKVVGLALAGALMLAPLTGCPLHLGGAGGPHVYYLPDFTEQDVLAVIRNKLEAEGFNFDFAVPAYTVEAEGVTFEIRLFDAERNVGIVYASENTSRLLWWLSPTIEERFAQLNDDIIVRLFHNPGFLLGHRADKRNIFDERIDNQVRRFLGDLMAENIVFSESPELILRTRYDSEGRLLYVAHLAEWDAWGIFFNKFVAEGFPVIIDPARVSAFTDSGGGRISFSATIHDNSPGGRARQINLSYFTWDSNNHPVVAQNPSALARSLEERPMHNNMVSYALYNPGVILGPVEDGQRWDETQKEATKNMLITQIETQVRAIVG